VSDFTVILDMDSTVYDLLSPTLDYVNDRYSLALGYKDVDVWRWDTKYNINLVDFWNTEGTYLDLEPFPHAIDAIKQVHDMGVKQIFLSSGNFKYGTEKFAAVDRDFPFIGSKNTLLTGGNKEIVHGDLLFDDAAHNLEAFPGGKVLVDMHQAPYCSYGFANAIMMDWRAYPSLIKSFKFASEGWG
jgi:5'-nucleotidase